VLIDAVALGVRHGLDVRLAIAGEGRHRQELEARAASLGVADRVEFLGQLRAGEAVRAELDRADLFVLPSRTEGLPRAMIEAMARGLPCIGTRVGGIPELLPPEDMVPPGDAPALCEKIREMVSDPQRMARASDRNLRVAQEYRDETLRERRVRFYRRVRDATAAWLGETARPGRAGEPRPSEGRVADGPGGRAGGVSGARSRSEDARS
jgi:glycosyltransferase involved in cell wall biosynthesis